MFFKFAFVSFESHQQSKRPKMYFISKASFLLETRSVSKKNYWKMVRPPSGTHHNTWAAGRAGAAPGSEEHRPREALARPSSYT